MKFKLICEQEQGDLVTHEFEQESLGSILIRIQDFLKGCGFDFVGQLTIDYDEDAQINLNLKDDDDENDGRC